MHCYYFKLNLNDSESAPSLVPLSGYQITNNFYQEQILPQEALRTLFGKDVAGELSLKMYDHP